jgi:hypothetical protein
MGGAAGYAGGAMTGTGGAIGARLTDADEDADLERPELEQQVGTGAPDTPGIDEPVGPTEVAGPEDPDA